MIEYRPIDHQSTMGAYVGQIGVKDGKGYMKNWRFVDGKDALPSDADVQKMRPKN
jgi:branched-chain amino acid transport system substrate-binding protein